MAKKRLYLIDAHSYLYKVFYAIRGLATKKGLPTNAVYGFAVMLNKVIREHKPDYLAVAFDSKEPTFRHQEYKEYKAKREKMPEDLIAQMPYVDRLVEAHGIPVLRVAGAEADDIIGTVTRSAEAQGLEVTVITADRDIWQLIDENVRVLRDVAEEKWVGPEEVMETYKVPPEKIPDIKGLAGDTSDNIPGVRGIGEKTAADLISQFGDLESVLARADQVKRDKTRESLKQFAEDARLSKRLATINTAVPLDLRLEQLKLYSPDVASLGRLYDELEFARLKAELPTAEMPWAEVVEHKGVHPRTGVHQVSLESVLRAAREVGRVAVYPLLDSEDVMRASLLGVGLSAVEEGACYLRAGGGIPPEIRGLLSDKAVTKVGHDIKSLLIIASRLGIKFSGEAVDSSIAAYLLEPGWDSYSLDSLTARYLEESTLFDKERVKRDSKEGHALFVKRQEEVGCEGCHLSLRLWNSLLPRLQADALEGLFNDLEMPLARVLADMELAGVKLDVLVLEKMSRELEEELSELTREIHGIAGEEFNINSPIQLRKILFEVLKLSPPEKVKKTQVTKEISTDIATLEAMAAEHPLPAKVLDYRMRAKLKSTYVDALPALINRETGKVHTSFEQTVAATGRLSSKAPNLQNIPVRTPMGKRIRRAFVAEQGAKLLCADYSQIELRVLAHLSGEPGLTQAFERGEDVHLRTATEIFGVRPEEVTPQMRDMAKTVNFGLMYGMSAFRLSRELKISTSDAKRYIDRYFGTYKGVRSYWDGVLKEGRQKGYVTTLLGRRRYLPEINSQNKNIRDGAEREAINTPIQGTAADMIKVAMVSIWRRIQGMKSRMILSVHDELIFECPDNELEEMKVIAKECMEGAIPLSVPIKVNFSVGPNWGEAY